MAGDQRDLSPRAGLLVDLKELLDLHGDRLLRSAYLLCGDETEAEDMVQETFLRAIKTGHRFRGDSAIYTWLYAILRNVCYRFLRKQKRFLFDDELLAVEPCADTQADPWIDDFSASNIAESLQKLPPEQREVIILRYYENLKVEEIAKRVGAPAGTIKSRLHHGVHRLEQMLSKEMKLLVSEAHQ